MKAWRGSRPASSPVALARHEGVEVVPGRRQEIQLEERAAPGVEVGVQLGALVQVLGAVVRVEVDPDDRRREDLRRADDLLGLDQRAVDRLALRVRVQTRRAAEPVRVVALALPQLVLRGALAVPVAAQLVHEHVGVHHLRVHEPALGVAHEELPEVPARRGRQLPTFGGVPGLAPGLPAVGVQRPLRHELRRAVRQVEPGERRRVRRCALGVTGSSHAAFFRTRPSSSSSQPFEANGGPVPVAVTDEGDDRRGPPGFGDAGELCHEVGRTHRRSPGHETRLHGDDRHVLALVLGHAGVQQVGPRGAREVELRLVEERVLHAAGPQRGSERRVPHLFGQPATPRPRAEAHPQVRGHLLQLAQPVVRGDHGEDRVVVPPADDLHLAPPHHLGDQHHQLGVALLEPLEQQPAVVQRGRHLGKSVEGAEEGPESLLVDGLGNRFRLPQRQVVVRPDDEGQAVHRSHPTAPVRRGTPGRKR